MVEKSKISGRKLKKDVLAILENNQPYKAWEILAAHDPMRVVNPLFAALLSASPRVKWHAVTLFGQTVPLICKQKGLEQGRIIMRRFMWMLNDESGGIGWGIPESMGEVMACHEQLAREYHSILLSYMWDSGGKDNFLEYAPLRRGAFWGAARLAQSRPDMVTSIGNKIIWALENEEDIYILVGAMITAKLLEFEVGWHIQQKLDMNENVSYYWNERFQNVKLSEIMSDEFIFTA